jgi:hypothetical protein
MRGAIHPLPQYAFMAWCPVKKQHRNNFTFTFTLPNFIFVTAMAIFSSNFEGRQKDI